MSEAVHIDPTALTHPADFDILLETCTTINDQNVRSWAGNKIVAGDDRRRVSDLDGEDFLSLCIHLKDAGDAPNPPKFLILAMEARGEGGSAEEVDARQKMALCQSLVEYLWRCADHGNLQIGGGFLVLPGIKQAERKAPDSPGAADNTGGEGSLAGGGTRKRTLDELHEAMDELSERQSLAEGLGLEGAASAEPSPKRPLTFISIPNKFKVAFDALLAKAPALEQMPYAQEGHKITLMLEIRHLVTELVRLATLDPSLCQERRFVADLNAGLEHSMLGGQLDTAAVWLHGKLLSSSEEGQQVDRAKIVKELANISKFMSGTKTGAGSSGPWGGSPIQPVALAQHLGGHGRRGQSMYSAAPSRGRGGGRGAGVRRQPMCGKCRDAGKRGNDLLHSFKFCPLVKCSRCQQMGHISRNCTN